MSYHYIRQSGDFIVAIPDESHLKAIHFCGVHSGRDTDKISHLHLATTRGKDVSPLSITSCLANIECRVRDIYFQGDRPSIVGEVLSIDAPYPVYNQGWRDDVRFVYYEGGSIYRIGNERVDMSLIRPGYVPRIG